MDINNPTWPDETFLQSVLQGDSKETVEILEFSTKPAVGPGANYTSYIYRVRVVYRSNCTPQKQSTATLIIKKPIETGLMTEMIGCSTMLDKEQQMYDVLLPRMYKKSNLEFGPKSYISPLKNIVVMNDLKAHGYVMSGSKNQLDYFHCKTVFQTIAKFHAASISCYHEDPALVSESVGIDSLWVDGTPMENWMSNAIKCTVKVVKEMNVDKRFKYFFLRRADYIWDSAKVAVKSKPKGLNVLNHGDLWDNNLLFKYDQSNNVTGVKLLDFQNTKFASPVVDLFYFVWTSANEEVRQNSQRELYEVYINQLNSSLEQLGCQERLSTEELLEDLRTYKDWVLFILCFCLPVQMSAPEDALDLSTFTREDFGSSKYQKLFDGQYYRSCLTTFAKQFTEFFLMLDSQAI